MSGSGITLCLLVMAIVSATSIGPVRAQFTEGTSLQAPVPGLPYVPGPPPAAGLMPPSEEKPNVAPPRQTEALAAAIGALAPAGWNAGKMVVSAGAPPGEAISLQQSQVLQEFRCRSSVTRWFQRGQRRCYVRAFIFDNPTSAYGAYTVLRVGATTVVTRGDGSSEDDQSISFWQGDCFVNAYTTAQDDDEAKDLLRLVADRIAPAIETHASLPRLIAGLPQLDRISGSERVAMGPVVARQAFPAPYISVLAIEKSKGAASADYHFTNPNPERMKLMVVDYGDNALARSVYNEYVNSLEAAHGGEMSDTQSLFKMRGTYLLCQLRGAKMAIITGGRRKVSPLMLARQITYGTGQ